MEILLVLVVFTFSSFPSYTQQNNNLNYFETSLFDNEIFLKNGASFFISPIYMKFS